MPANPCTGSEHTARKTTASLFVGLAVSGRISMTRGAMVSLWCTSLDTEPATALPAPSCTVPSVSLKSRRKVPSTSPVSTVTCHASSAGATLVTSGGVSTTPSVTTSKSSAVRPATGSEKRKR